MSKIVKKNVELKQESRIWNWTHHTYKWQQSLSVKLRWKGGGYRNKNVCCIFVWRKEELRLAKKGQILAIEKPLLILRLWDLLWFLTNASVFRFFMHIALSQSVSFIFLMLFSVFFAFYCFFRDYHDFHGNFKESGKGGLKGNVCFWSSHPWWALIMSFCLCCGKGDQLTILLSSLSSLEWTD